MNGFLHFIIPPPRSKSLRRVCAISALLAIVFSPGFNSCARPEMLLCRTTTSSWRSPVAISGSQRAPVMDSAEIFFL